MSRILVTALAIVLGGSITVMAQPGSAAKRSEPFKVGTFVIGNTQTMNLVQRDSLVVDFVQANAALENTQSLPARPMPSDMVDLIGQYEHGLKARLYAIVNELVQSKALEAKRPAFVHELNQVKTLAPIPRPRQIMICGYLTNAS